MGANLELGANLGLGANCGRSCKLPGGSKKKIAHRHRF